jgi:glycosyltransferase involved in cell wall biosynthesis
MTSGTLRVGYLHVGRPRSGLRRYAAILAAEAATRAGVEVLESDVGGREAGWSELRAAAERLRDADVVHVQWKTADWDPRFGGIPRLEVVLRSLRRPLVVTMHDVFVPQGRWSRRISPIALGIRRLAHAATSLVVHSEDERVRLDGFAPAGKVEVVPHFVEVRRSLPDRAVARAKLGLADRRAVTLLGTITKRRGHRLVIDAVAKLPSDITALFVGSSIEGRDHVRLELEEHAAQVGVADRVRFLGYLPEDELEEVLVATDVALCPFRAMSASGALATWISAGRPIVASDLAPIRELEALAPGALQAFAPYEPEPLAERIREALELSPAGQHAPVVALARRLATPRIMERYLGLYRAAAQVGDRDRPRSGDHLS